MRSFSFRQLILPVSLGVAVALSGCASTGGGSSASDAPPAKPAKKAFVAPSFDSTEFKSAEHGFLLHYPSDFNTEEPQGPTGLLTAASPMMAPRIDVNLVPDSSLASLDESAAAVEAQMKALSGGEATITAKAVSVLQDGVTEAHEFQVSWAFQGFPLNSLVLVAPAGSNLVNITVTGMDGGDVEELKGIAYTLYVD